MKYYKVLTNKVFYSYKDNENGGTHLNVETSDEILKFWGDINGVLEFIEKSEGKPFIIDDYEDTITLSEDFDDSESYSEDGYISYQQFYSYIEISEQEYLRLKEVISSYENEINNFK